MSSIVWLSIRDVAEGAATFYKVTLQFIIIKLCWCLLNYSTGGFDPDVYEVDPDDYDGDDDYDDYDDFDEDENGNENDDDEEDDDD